MTTSAWSRYLAFARIAATQARRARGELYGRMAFFAVILGVFSSLWRAVAEAGMPIAADPGSLVWYLAVTEWILFSAPPVHLEIQETIRRGDVVYRLGHPASFVAAVRRLTEAPQLVETFKKNAVAVAEREYHWGRFEDRFLRLVRGA